jgi:hypothetical protein
MKDDFRDHGREDIVNDLTTQGTNLTLFNPFVD